MRTGRGFSTISTLDFACSQRLSKRLVRECKAEARDINRSFDKHFSRESGIIRETFDSLLKVQSERCYQYDLEDLSAKT